MDAGAADPDLLSMSTGQSVERLRDAADAGAAMHVVDTEGESCHGDWMHLTPNRR
jgi:hypothetical protein